MAKKTSSKRHVSTYCPRESNVKSVAEAFKKAIEIIGDWSGGTENSPVCTWFRGVDSNGHDLVPKAYRPSFKYEEFGALVEFIQEAAAFSDVKTVDCWQTYYLAQHYGMPTRLLDWTESFTAALFFAIDTWDGSSKPCVWMMRPELLNQHAINWHGILTAENSNSLDIWLPRRMFKREVIEDGDFKYDNNTPVAIYPRKSNLRIIAQQGTFTVHGIARQPLNEFVRRCPEPKSLLARINLSIDSRDKWVNELNMLGVRKHSIYPEVDKLVQHLKDTYKW